MLQFTALLNGHISCLVYVVFADQNLHGQTDCTICCILWSFDLYCHSSRHITSGRRVTKRFRNLVKQQAGRFGMYKHAYMRYLFCIRCSCCIGEVCHNMLCLSLCCSDPPVKLLLSKLSGAAYSAQLLENIHAARPNSIPSKTRLQAQFVHLCLEQGTAAVLLFQLV